LEHILTNSYKDGMIHYLNSHPEDFDEAIQLAVTDKQPYSWRAAWLLWSCMEVNDVRIRVYVKNIIDAIPSAKDGQKRELLNVLLKMELSEDDEGRVFSMCVDIWEQIHKRPSVRWKAFHLIVRMMQKYPDLIHEIEFLTQDQYIDSLSPGIKYSIKNVLKDIPQKIDSGCISL